MTWFAAITTGFGLGLASFGVLWLAVRRLVRLPQRRALIGASTFVRLFLVGIVMYALSREGPDKLLAGLTGLWLARWCLFLELAEGRYGR